MPRLGQIVTDKATVSVPLGEDVLTVVYRPKKLTPEFQERVSQAQGATAIRDGLYRPVAELLVSWDLTEDDGTPIDPSDEGALRCVPTVVLFAVIKAVMEDMQTSPLTRGASSNGSSQTASSELRQIGTAS